MALKKEAYLALEDVVGPEYITDEPAILDSYCYVWGNQIWFGDKFSPRPDAVILPGSTEEVQAIVKVCNRYGVKYRAHATGHSPMGISAPATPGGFMPMDLRRMNRILDIDEKNMHAVVEPYVATGHLIMECIKRGVRPFASGGGPSLSVIAGTCCFAGGGPATVSVGYGAALVWVLNGFYLTERY